MSAISKVLVQQSHLEIFNINRTTQIDMKGWCANQKYFVDDNLSANSFRLRSSDQDYLKSALANDCNRMAMAAIESIAGINEDSTFKKSGAWGVIRTYYATFFAIHSILRMFGISCSQLEQDHVDKIFEFAVAVSKEGGLRRLEKGFYSIEVDQSFSYVNFYKYKDSHRDTWGQFLSLLDKLLEDSQSVTALSKYKIEAIDILSKVKSGITRSRCSDKGNWLSVVRNSVNYKHSHGVWYPYERSAISLKYLSRINTEWRKQPEELALNINGDDIEIFFEVGLLINSVFRELLISCSSKTEKPNRIFINGSLKLLNTLKAA